LYDVMLDSVCISTKMNCVSSSSSTNYV